MIKRLRLKGFRRYVDETFELGPGVTFINGRNNAGKTTLFLAIEYALTGTVAGARSQAFLLHPEAKGLGVEMVFSARDGKTYKLQRLHQMPARGKSRLIGHFTLKEIVGPEDERYVLSSDFQDHEDALAKKLAEITGITRRILHLAVHVRQGEIAQILDGDPRLDIALGITAAGTANEEMRSLALVDEEAAQALPAVEASFEHLERERNTSSVDESAASQRLEELRAEAKTLGQPDPEPEVDNDAGFARAFDAWRDAAVSVTRAEATLAAYGDGATLDNEKAELEAAIASARPDDLQKLADLRARIERRDALIAAGDPVCEHCGSTIDLAQAKKELAAWRKEAATLEASAIDVPELRGQLREVTRRVAERGVVANTLERATATRKRSEAGVRAIVDGDPRALDVIAAERRAERENKTLERAMARARAEAKLEAAEAAIDEIEARITAQQRRGAELEREHARLSDELDRLRRRVRRAADLRTLAGAFKELQERLRTRAASELAESTFAIHKALSVDHEIESIEVDPTRYQVLVTSASTKQVMPASLAQGGGHRLLLGLAFRLALVKRLGPFPFMLLDEPTYGLDERHRKALLERITKLGSSEQILLVTHQDMGHEPDSKLTINTERQS